MYTTSNNFKYEEIKIVKILVYDTSSDQTINSSNTWESGKQ